MPTNLKLVLAAGVGFSVALGLVAAVLFSDLGGPAPDYSDAMIVNSTTTTFEPSARTTGKELWMLHTHREHRVVVYRECSPEHCSSTARLELLSIGFPREVLAASDLIELAERPGSFVVGLAVEEFASEGYEFLLQVEDTYGGRQPYTLRIAPSASSYKARFQDGS